MTDIFYVSLDAWIDTELKTMGVPFCEHHLLDQHVIGSRQVVVIGKAEAAERFAQNIVSRGIAASQVGYLAVTNPAELGRALDEDPRHIYWRDAKPLRDAPDPSSFVTYPSGLDFLDMNLKWGWRLPELVIVAGPYGSGKSTILQQLAFNFVRENGRKLGNSGALICAWEDEASEMRANLQNFIKGKSSAANEYDYLLDKVHYVQRNPDDDRLISWYMDLVTFYNTRYGTKFFTLDPWNELDHVKDVRQLETDYIKEMMKQFRRLVDKLGIILCIATHVAAKSIRGDGSIEPFKIGHAFGSSQFANKADRGLCIVRTKKFERERGHTIIRHDKSKIERKMGRKGTIAVRLDERFFDLQYDGMATMDVADIWKD